MAFKIVYAFHAATEPTGLDVSMIDGMIPATDNELFGDFLNQQLVRVGVVGGECFLEAHASQALLRVQYYCDDRLSDEQLESLVKYTVAQFHDGIGENGISFHVPSGEIIASIADDAPVIMEQSQVATHPYISPRVAIAAFDGDDQALNEAILRYPNSINQRFDGFPGLHFVIADKSKVELLLSHHANPNLLNAFGYTALHYLIVASRLSEDKVIDLARLLIQYGADKTLLDSSGKTPKDRATDSGLFKLVALLA